MSHLLLPIDTADPVVRDSPLLRGLTADWWPTDQQSGGRAVYDIAGPGHYHATLSGGSWAGGPFGPAVRHAGGSAYLDVSAAPGPVSGSFAIVFLLHSKATGANHDAQTIFSTDSYNLYLSVGGGTLNNYKGAWRDGTRAIPTDRPCVVALSYDGVTIRTWVDGIPDRADAVGTSYTWTTAYIGRRVDGYAGPATWTGDVLGALYFRGRVLTDAEQSGLARELLAGRPTTLRRIETRPFFLTIPPTFEDGYGTAAGSAAGSGVLSALLDGLGRADGGATVAGDGSALLDGYGTAAGIAAAAGALDALADGVGAAGGVATGDGTLDAISDGSGSAAGVATGSGEAGADLDGVGSAAGMGAVAGSGDTLVDGFGAVAGSASTTATGDLLADGFGTAAGVTVVGGVIQDAGAGERPVRAFNLTGRASTAFNVEGRGSAGFAITGRGSAAFNVEGVAA